MIDSSSGFARRTDSDQVTRPAFSIALKVTVCGMTSWSSLAKGKGIPKYFSTISRIGPLVSAA